MGIKVFLAVPPGARIRILNVDSRPYGCIFISPGFEELVSRMKSEHRYTASRDYIVECCTNSSIYYNAVDKILAIAESGIDSSGRYHTE